MCMCTHAHTLGRQKGLRSPGPEVTHGSAPSTPSEPHTGRVYVGAHMLHASVEDERLLCHFVIPPYGCQGWNSHSQAPKLLPFHSDICHALLLLKCYLRAFPHVLIKRYCHL